MHGLNRMPTKFGIAEAEGEVGFRGIQIESNGAALTSGENIDQNRDARDLTAKIERSLEKDHRPLATIFEVLQDCCNIEIRRIDFSLDPNEVVGKCSLHLLYEFVKILSQAPSPSLAPDFPIVLSLSRPCP
jgi:hypothetical protein